MFGSMQEEKCRRCGSWYHENEECFTREMEAERQRKKEMTYEEIIVVGSMSRHVDRAAKDIDLVVKQRGLEKLAEYLELRRVHHEEFERIMNGCQKWTGKNEQGKRYEIILVPEQSEVCFQMLFDNLAKDGVGSRLKIQVVPNAPFYAVACSGDELATLKRSHLNYPIHFEKNIEDYHALLKKGFKVIPEMLEVWKETMLKYHGAKKARIKLNVKNEDFFGKSQKVVGRSYEHDSIHKAVMYYREPLYERCKVDKTKAAISHDLFKKMPDFDQRRMALEEGYAIALERFIIPEKLSKRQYKLALKKSLEMLCTKMSKGWFSDFIVDNFPTLLDESVNYVELFEKGVENGTVREIISQR